MNSAATCQSDRVGSHQCVRDAVLGTEGVASETEAGSGVFGLIGGHQLLLLGLLREQEEHEGSPEQDGDDARRSRPSPRRRGRTDFAPAMIWLAYCGYCCGSVVALENDFVSSDCTLVGDAAPLRARRRWPW